MTTEILNPVIVKIATADTEQDLIDNDGENKALSLLTQISNDNADKKSVEIWITDGSNIKLFPLLPTTDILGKSCLSNSTKLVLKSGNKIRITANSTDIYAMVCAVSGV